MLTDSKHVSGAGVRDSNDPPDGILLDFMCKEHPEGHFIAFGPLEGHPRGVFSGTGPSRMALLRRGRKQKGILFQHNAKTVKWFPTKRQGFIPEALG